MLTILARAEGPDTTDSNLTIVMIGMLTVAIVCFIAAIPVVTARRRRLGTEGIAALMVLWGLLAAGSIVYFANAQLTFSKEYTMRIMQNYDPSDQSDRPKIPWMIWGCLAAAYGGAIIWSSSARIAPRRGFPIDPPSPPTDPT